MPVSYNKSMKISKRLALFVVMGVIGIVVALAMPAPAKALSGSDFSAGNIISNGIFFNGSDMDAATIQSFLNSKVPVCDTNGTQAYGGTTRAAYSTSKGYPPPYTCLKDYHENVPMKAAETGLCTGLGSGVKSAAQIIYEVGVSCGVNPKVLIVLLQKEQSLVTDDWPWPTQYRSATGYGCPDTAACDSEYYGFFNQVYNAARQFKRYGRDAQLFTYRAGVNNYIQYNPNSSCGGSSVYIQNQATASLYNYTPYQPNPPALNNLYGSGDACSAYGNRNFWRMYNDWFGSTQIPISCTGNETPLPYVIRYYHPRTFMHFYSAYACDATFLKWLGYVQEVAVFNTTPASASWALPVYRYYNPRTGLHSWTTQYLTSEQLAASNTGYQQEAGIVFYVARPDMPNVHKVQQFYNPQTYIHLFAAEPNQQDIDYLKSRAGFDMEGTAFYAQ